MCVYMCNVHNCVACEHVCVCVCLHVCVCVACGVHVHVLCMCMVLYVMLACSGYLKIMLLGVLLDD